MWVVVIVPVILMVLPLGLQMMESRLLSDVERGSRARLGAPRAVIAPTRAVDPVVPRPRSTTLRRRIPARA